ncbi:hypothetical protein GCM10009801_11070 [Streptomyces albiaxialis]|uniref:Uncharacterized protein n=1 Tax=Streptomyces albiaxialis TaxID=329523 RepID=A0ABN2VMZ8_9ACTN
MHEQLQGESLLLVPALSVCVLPVRALPVRVLSARFLSVPARCRALPGTLVRVL